MVTGTDSTVYALVAFGGKLFLGGQFTAVDGNRAEELRGPSTR
jgi:hypothetical protein